MKNLLYILFVIFLLTSNGYSEYVNEFTIQHKYRTKQLVENLVNKGIITQEEADSLLEKPKVDLADAEAFAASELEKSRKSFSDLPDADEIKSLELSAIEDDILERQRKDYPKRPQTLTETVESDFKSEQVSKSQRSNYQRTLENLYQNPEKIADANARFLMLPDERKAEAIKHIGDGKSPGVAMGDWHIFSPYYIYHHIIAVVVICSIIYLFIRFNRSQQA